MLSAHSQRETPWDEDVLRARSLSTEKLFKRHRLLFPKSGLDLDLGVLEKVGTLQSSPPQSKALSNELTMHIQSFCAGPEPRGDLQRPEQAI